MVVIQGDTVLDNKLLNPKSIHMTLGDKSHGLIKVSDSWCLTLVLYFTSPFRILLVDTRDKGGL